MINTKTVFIIFIILSLFTFPYLSLIASFNNDFVSSIVPGWNTTIYPIGVLIKFFVLVLVTYYCWKLSKRKIEVNFKKIVIYLSLTIPGVIVSKYGLANFIDFDTIVDIKDFDNQLQILSYVSLFIHILFFIGQVLFFIFYKKSMRKLT